MIIKVAVPGPFEDAFDYLPIDNQHLPAIGTRVKIPLHAREVIGVVVGYSDSSHLPTHKLRWISSYLDQTAIFDSSLLSFLQWVADYYHAPLGEVCQLALPSLLREGKAATLPAIPLWRLTEQGQALSEQDFSRSKKQLAAWQIFKQHPAGLTKTELSAQKISSSVLKNLIEKAYLEITTSHNECAKTYHQNGSLCCARTDSLQLNHEQQQAFDAIYAAHHHFQAFLLFGATGSGKTEIYLQLIDKILTAGKQVLVLVPEIGLTPQTLVRFQARFDCHIALLHSSLTPRERLNNWLLAKENLAPIVIGTRTAVFAPLDNLGLIIIDEEHDLSFKQQDGIRYSARDVAVMRAHQLNIPIVLGSATPSLESWHNYEKNRYQLLSLKERHAGASMPEIKLIDLRNHYLNEGLSEPLIHAIRNHLAQDQQILLFLNRRGFSPALLCQKCGWSPVCSQCDTRLSYHAKPPKLICHHCGHQQKIRYQCHQCHGSMIPLGHGTQRLETALQALFPDIPIHRIDRDSTQRKGSFDQILNKIHQGGKQILIGTQMLAKGHHFPKVTLVGVLNADGGLYSHDFRAPEHLAQLLLQVAGRAGRESKAGEVLVQTFWPDHPLLQLLISQGYEAFAIKALQERSFAHLPPFYYLALICAEAKQAAQAEDFLQTISDFAHPLLNTSLTVTILGPIPALQAKKAGVYRSHLLLQSHDRQALHKLLNQLLPKINKLKKTGIHHWFLDIDPLQLD